MDKTDNRLLTTPSKKLGEGSTPGPCGCKVVLDKEAQSKAIKSMEFDDWRNEVPLGNIQILWCDMHRKAWLIPEMVALLERGSNGPIALATEIRAVLAKLEE